jgi:hypothetical protein
MEVTKLKEALEREEAKRRARFEQRLGRPLSKDEWAEVRRRSDQAALRRMKKTIARTFERALENVPAHLKTEQNLRRFEKVPLYELATTILATDARARNLRRYGGREHRRPSSTRRLVRTSPSRGDPSSSDADEDDDDIARQRRIAAETASRISAKQSLTSYAGSKGGGRRDGRLDARRSG